MPANLLVAGMARSYTCKIMVVFNTLWNNGHRGKRRSPDEMQCNPGKSSACVPDSGLWPVSGLRY